MKISIITSVWNNKETIKDAIESVLSQTYKNIEYIVVDGASSDGTIEIVQKYRDNITKFISEKDSGIYDGLNRGISLATGDVVAFLHSDDIYANYTIIEEIAQQFESDESLDGIYGDLVYTPKNDTDKVLRYWKSKEFEIGLLSKGWMPAHPTFFVKRKVYERYGMFRTDLKIAADFDILIRFLLTHKISYSYIQEVLVKMRIGGVSTSFNSIWINNIETLRVCRDNGVKTNIFKILSKYPAKILGLLKK